MAERPAWRAGRASLVKSGTRPTNSGCRYVAAAAASTRNFAQDDARRPRAEIVTMFCIALERARTRASRCRRSRVQRAAASAHTGPTTRPGASSSYAKRPTSPRKLVYHPTVRPELRPVTSGGPLDGSTRHYRDNLVVFAVQA
jgi:hypothetical protein